MRKSADIRTLILLQKEDELEGLKTVRTIGDLPSPSETSISIITPPKVRSTSHYILELWGMITHDRLHLVCLSKRKPSTYLHYGYSLVPRTSLS